MSELDRTLYDVLGVKRSAKQGDINRAWARLQADQQREDSAPDARLMIQAKVAYETLSDPDKRDEYDALLSRRAFMGKNQRNKSFVYSMAAVVAIAAVGVAIWLWRTHEADEAARGKPLSTDQLLAAVGPQLWHVQGALMTGEVRDLGTAVALRENKLITTCQGLVASMVLTVKSGDYSTTAELANPNPEVDICVLKAKSATADLKLRRDPPGAQERFQAIFVNASGRTEVRQVSGPHMVADAQGPALEVKAAAPLPNGSAIFDVYGKLVGIVVSPHAASDGAVFALGSMRIGQAKGTGIEKAFVEAAPPARNIEAPEPPPAQAVDDLGRPVTRPGMSAREKAKAEQDAAIEHVLKDAK